MPLVTNAAPYQLAGGPVLVSVFLNTGAANTEALIDGVWRNTGDLWTNGTHRIPIVGPAKVRFVCTGNAVVEVHE